MLEFSSSATLTLTTAANLTKTRNFGISAKHWLNKNNNWWQGECRLFLLFRIFGSFLFFWRSIQVCYSSIERTTRTGMGWVLRMLCRKHWTVGSWLQGHQGVICINLPRFLLSFILKCSSGRDVVSACSSTASPHVEVSTCFLVIVDLIFDDWQGCFALGRHVDITTTSILPPS